MTSGAAKPLRAVLHGTVILMLAIIEMALSWPDAYFPDPIDGIVAGANAPYPFTDRTGTLVPGVRVLGVEHSPAAFARHGAHVLDAIAAADVVLLEWDEGTYFGALARQAQEAGKAVVWIDRRSDSLLAVTLILPPVALTVLGLLMLTSAAGRQGWRVLCLVLASLAATTASPSPACLLGRIGVEAPWATLSYVEDGRTVAMLDDLERAAARQPGRKLAIVGDLHARMFHHYASHPDARRWRRQLYAVIYAPFAPDHNAPTAL